MFVLVPVCCYIWIGWCCLLILDFYKLSNGGSRHSEYACDHKAIGRWCWKYFASSSTTTGVVSTSKFKQRKNLADCEVWILNLAAPISINGVLANLRYEWVILVHVLTLLPQFVKLFQQIFQIAIWDLTSVELYKCVGKICPFEFHIMWLK